jgi:hypothetical protein
MQTLYTLCLSVKTRGITRVLTGRSLLPVRRLISACDLYEGRKDLCSKVINVYKTLIMRSALHDLVGVNFGDCGGQAMGPYQLS